MEAFKSFRALIWLKEQVQLVRVCCLLFSVILISNHGLKVFMILIIFLGSWLVYFADGFKRFCRRGRFVSSLDKNFFPKQCLGCLVWIVQILLGSCKRRMKYKVKPRCGCGLLDAWYLQLSNSDKGYIQTLQSPKRVNSSMLSMPAVMIR